METISDAVGAASRIVQLHRRTRMVFRLVQEIEQRGSIASHSRNELNALQDEYERILRDHVSEHFFNLVGSAYMTSLGFIPRHPGSVSFYATYPYQEVLRKPHVSFESYRYKGIYLVADDISGQSLANSIYEELKLWDKSISRAHVSCHSYEEVLSSAESLLDHLHSDSRLLVIANAFRPNEVIDVYKTFGVFRENKRVNWFAQTWSLESIASINPGTDTSNIKPPNLLYGPRAFFEAFSQRTGGND